mmetsp:Transcript_37103/g.69196  ORF Transcript_37103/g.69196 Transcript_37103/m.69196 type:complete len:262 (+) Transcript_37103:406-1191(+)
MCGRGHCGRSCHNTCDHHHYHDHDGQQRVHLDGACRPHCGAQPARGEGRPHLLGLHSARRHQGLLPIPDRHLHHLEFAGLLPPWRQHFRIRRAGQPEPSGLRAHRGRWHLRLLRMYCVGSGQSGQLCWAGHCRKYGLPGAGRLEGDVHGGCILGRSASGMHAALLHDALAALAGPYDHDDHDISNRWLLLLGCQQGLRGKWILLGVKGELRGLLHGHLEGERAVNYHRHHHNNNHHHHNDNHHHHHNHNYHGHHNHRLRCL